MSARDELRAAVVAGLGAGKQYTDEVEEREAAALIDAFAHELAEQIRAAAGDVNYGDAASAARHAYAEEFASIIDPEAPGG